MLRLVNGTTLLTHPEPMELNIYQSLVMNDIESTKAMLHRKYASFNFEMIYCLVRWFPEVQNIFYHGNKRKQIPFAKLDSFFESAAVLMTNLLRELALDSINEYERVFCPLPVSYYTLKGTLSMTLFQENDKIGLFPGFVISAVICGTKVEFEPSVHGFEVGLIKLLSLT